VYANELTQALESRISLEESTEDIYAKAYALVPYAGLLKKLFSIYMRTGGYPKSINSYFQGLPSKSAFSIGQEVYEELYLYAKSDAATLSGAGKAGNMAFAEGVLRSTLGHIGSNISHNKLAANVSMNSKTFNEYLRRLGESYVFIALNGLDNKLNPMRMQKTYFGDPLLHYSVGSNIAGEEPNKYTEAVINSENIGIIAEEIIAQHLLQTKENEPMRTYNTYLHFLKGNGNKEIDFVYKKDDGNYLGIEVKYQNSVSAKNDIYTVKGIDEYIIVSKDTLEKGKSAIAVPIYLLLALLEKSDKDL
ncbi:MAG: DUF4143 domain-containing protein, partial [Candidatus Micrarchaeia archaeon]